MDLIYQHLDWREKMNELSKQQKAEDLFRELMLVFNGDVEQARIIWRRTPAPCASSSVSRPRTSNSNCETWA